MHGWIPGPKKNNQSDISGPIAQLVLEHVTFNHGVLGSSPSGTTNYKSKTKMNNLKRLVIVLIVALVSISASAETLSFRTQAYSERTLRGGSWSSWSKWYDSNMLITMNLSTDIVTVYSPKVQQYRIIDYGQTYYSDGCQCVDYHFYDQDGDRGTMSLVIKPSGQSEIYIRFANIQWSYIVIRI